VNRHRSKLTTTPFPNHTKYTHQHKYHRQHCDRILYHIRLRHTYFLPLYHTCDSDRHSFRLQCNTVSYIFVLNCFLNMYLTVAITLVSKMNTRENITASMMDTIFYHSILYLRLFTVLYSFHAVTFLAISIENQ
jgi:hypothetical protein